ncbi:hypothetical protein Tco_0674989 [Tanacetum coccineum]
MENIIARLRTNGRLLPYARLLTQVFEYDMNELLNQGHFTECNGMALILTNFNANHLEQTDIVYTQPEHGVSSSSRPQMGPKERMDPQDGYKSYLTRNRQRRESRTKLEVLKNIVKNWATAIQERPKDNAFDPWVFALKQGGAIF